MKKIIILILATVFAVCLSVSAFAQEQEQAQKQEITKELTPVKGDFSVAVDMIPILRSLGNVFWGAPLQPQGFGGTSVLGNPVISIIGKYMLTDKVALRLNLGAAYASNTEGNNIMDDAAFYLDPLSKKEVTDYASFRRSGVSLNIGAEYRVGKKRVQGIFGGDLVLGLDFYSEKYSYGNVMTEDNQVPTISGVYAPYYNTHISPNTRLLLNRTPTTFSIGALVSAGVECFIAPKIALGGQVNMMYVFSYSEQSRMEGEGFNPISNKVEKVTQIVSPAEWSHNFGTNNFGASLYIAFYF